uniref:Homologous recombination OB-fold protein OB-fold domain-containing protein n=1 Tax=Tanacetum cinerariifolium TaxID=118510 RepID=A0A6L2JUN9_TANCI|nr:hypothetical protein [Tanacetum cinerariifolium]
MNFTYKRIARITIYQTITVEGTENEKNSSITHNTSLEKDANWEDLLDIDDSDLLLTLILRPYNNVRETITITSTQNTDGIVQVEETPVSIRPGPVGRDDSVLSTQEYMKQVVEDVREDEDFNNDNATISFHILKNGKLEQVVVIIKSCSPNALGDLKVTIKDLSGTLPGLLHYKVINDGTTNLRSSTSGNDRSDKVGAACALEMDAMRAITHPVIAIFIYPFGAVEAACALEVDAMGALDLVKV